MKLFALYATGLTSLSEYWSQMGTYRSLQGEYGWFLDHGTSIAVFGLGLLSASQGKRILRQIVILAAMNLVSFVFSFSRSDLIGVLIGFIFITAALNRPLFRSLLNRRWLMILGLPFVAFLIIIDTGIKSQLRTFSSYDTLGAVSLSLDELYDRTKGQFIDRFSQAGLYDGYCNLVNRLSDGMAPFYDGKVIVYTATAWVPYVIYKEKPMHPFRAVGYLIYDDYRTSIYDVSATMLVGSAFADYGIWSVILYLFVYGLLLGGIRKITVHQEGHILSLIWYLHFLGVDGASNMIHGGIVNFSDSFMLASGVMILTSIYLRIRLGPKSPSREAPMPSLVVRDVRRAG